MAGTEKEEKDSVEAVRAALPTEDVLTQRLSNSLAFWSVRNKYIGDVRRALNGQNLIEAPVSTQYKVRVIHSYVLAAVVQEKLSRFMARPVIQAIPDDDLDMEGRAKSSRIERALNRCMYEIERAADGDVWNRVVLDAILLDEGVERVDRAHGKIWPELAAEALAGEPGKYALGTKEREAYKRNKGVPIVKDYVPLENFFPTYDGNHLLESFEVEERSLLAARTNPLFQEAWAKEAFDGLPQGDKSGGVSTTVNIVQYVNDEYHAYYLAGTGANSERNKWPRITTSSRQFLGRLKFLYGYHHGIDESIYNCVGGRYGGWKTQHNRIEGVGKGLLELAQGLDELLSQVVTNVRARYWPNLNFQLDPELRGWGADADKRKPPKVSEGEAIVTFKGEEIKPIFAGGDDPMVMWLWSQYQERISALGGSPILFGQRQPGVDTGYHQALQQTQAESLDEKIEGNVAAGAIREAVLVMKHTIQLGESVAVGYVEEDKRTRTKSRKYAELDPADLDPIPMLDAQVRKQRPVDYVAALAAAKQASDEREGKGPLLSDDTIRAEILAINEPDREHAKIVIESQQRELLSSGVLSARIGDQVNIKIAAKGVPNVSPEQITKADPALLAAIKDGGVQGAAQAAGGTDPTMLGDVVAQTGLGASDASPGLPPGPVAGNPEMGNRVGEAALGAIQTGQPSI